MNKTHGSSLSENHMAHIKSMDCVETLTWIHWVSNKYLHLFGVFLRLVVNSFEVPDDLLVGTSISGTCSVMIQRSCVQTPDRCVILSKSNINVSDRTHSCRHTVQRRCMEDQQCEDNESDIEPKLKYTITSSGATNCIC